MTDETPRNDDGTYAPSEPLTGIHSVEEAQGFTRMSEPEIPAEPESDIRAEVERLQDSRLPENNPVVDLEYKSNSTGEKTDSNLTVSLDRASRDLNLYHQGQDEERARSVSTEFAREIDKMRADALKELPPEAAKADLGLSDADVKAAKNAKLAEDMGLSPEEIAAAEAQGGIQAIADRANATATNTPPADAFDNIEGLEPELKEVLRKSPQVRQFMEANATASDQAMHAFGEAAKHANTFGQAAIVTLVPGIDQYPIEQWPAIVNQLKQAGDPRGNQVESLLSNVAQASERQQIIEYHQQQVARQNFEATRKQYNAAADKFLPQTVAEKVQLAEDFAEYVGEYGVSREQLSNEWNSNLALQHPAFQRMAVDAMKFRAMQRAPKAVAHKDLPPVTRPGTSVHRSSGDNSSQIASLQKQVANLTGDKQIRAAARLQQLQRKQG